MVAAEPRDLGGSGAPGVVVSGEALIERVAPWWGIVRGVPGRGRIAGEELGLRRAPGRSDRGRMLGNAQVLEDGPHDTRVGEEGEDAHLTVAGGAAQRVDLVDAGEELGPAAARASVGAVGACVGYGAVDVGRGAWVGLVDFVTPVARHVPSPLRVRGEDAVIPMPVDARRGYQARESVEQLKGADTDDGAAVVRGTR